jgi:hemolysin activation/secretion protein
MLRIKPGDRIFENLLRADLQWINRNPFREAALFLKPGEKFGQTDILLEVKDRFPVRIYAGYENTGNILTGEDRYLCGMNWGDAFGLDHLFMYQYTTDNTFDRLHSHTAVYSIPLDWRHIWTIYGAYVETEVQQDVSIFRGDNHQISTRYEIPFADALSQGRLRHGIELGFDYKHSTNDLEFAGIRALETAVDILQWQFAYRFSLKDDLGISLFEIEGFASPGDLTSLNTDAVYRQARYQAKSNYIYGKTVIERQQKLPWGFYVIARARGQLASSNLLANEQIGAGGYNTVRGFEELEVRGDHGVNTNVELYTPPIPVLSLLTNNTNLKDQLQFLGFYDYAWIASQIRLLGEPPARTLSGIGVGVRYNLNRYLSFRFDYGWQLDRSGVAPKERDGRAHIGINVSF